MEPGPASATPAASLWQLFAAPLRSFVARRTPAGVEPDDIVQEVFLRIHEQLPGLRAADRVDAWIFQIARNVIVDAFRVRGRREALTDRAASEEPESPAADGEPAAEAELASCLAPMIRQLSEPYREAIELTELRGMTQVEAARRLGISVSGMKSRVQRGREHLKRMIGGFCLVEVDVRGGVTECDPRAGGGCGPAAPCARTS